MNVSLARPPVTYRSLLFVSLSICLRDDCQTFGVGLEKYNAKGEKKCKPIRIEVDDTILSIGDLNYNHER